MAAFLTRLKKVEETLESLRPRRITIVWARRWRPGPPEPGEVRLRWPPHEDADDQGGTRGRAEPGSTSPSSP